MNESRRVHLNAQVTAVRLEIHKLQELATAPEDIATLADVKSMLMDTTLSPTDDIDLVMIEKVEYALAMAAPRLRTLRAALVLRPDSDNPLQNG